jgi:hypothetical protein
MTASDDAKVPEFGVWAKYLTRHTQAHANTPKRRAKAQSAHCFKVFINVFECKL